jgi:hypothetical protein
MRSDQHDTAWACALAILDVFAPLLREEEKRDAFGEIYRRVLAAIEAYDTLFDRRLRRLKPGKN